MVSSTDVELRRMVSSGEGMAMMGCVENTHVKVTNVGGGGMQTDVTHVGGRGIVSSIDAKQDVPGRVASDGGGEILCTEDNACRVVSDGGGGVLGMVKEFEAMKKNNVENFSEDQEMTPVRRLLKTKLQNVTKLTQKKTTSEIIEKKDFSVITSDKKLRLLCLEESRESSVNQIKSQTVVLKNQNPIEQPRRPEITHKRGGGRRKETRTETKLRKTAENLKLKKISSIFETVPMGEYTTLSKLQTSDFIGVSWGVENCTGNTASILCDNQWEKPEQGAAKRHLGFGGQIGCDWMGGAEAKSVLEDVIGLGLEEGKCSANGEGASKT